MHKKCFFFPNKIYKKSCNVLKNGCKKIVFITKCNEKKLFETHYSLKKLSASPKNGNPLIKNNGPSLRTGEGVSTRLKVFCQ